MDKENLNDLVLLAKMNGYVVSSDDKPIVGTNALATCIGLLMYNPFNKKASVGHFSPTDDHSKVLKMISDMYLSIFDEEGFKVKYYIVPGFYEEHYRTLDFIFDTLSRERNVFELMDVEMDDAVVTLGEETGIPSIEFAFDTRNGTFVSKNVFSSDLVTLKSK